MKKISFIIPCYRSENTIGHVVKEIDDTMLCFEFDALMDKRLDVGFEPYLLSQPRFDACDCRFVERYYARLVKELVREMELCGAALD